MALAALMHQYLKGYFNAGYPAVISFRISNASYGLYITALIGAYDTSDLTKLHTSFFARIYKNIISAESDEKEIIIVKEKKILCT